MFERTLKIGSAGKLFGLTGWKSASSQGAGFCWRLRPRRISTSPSPRRPHLQVAVAEGLAWPEQRFGEQAAALALSREHLAEALKAEGFVVLSSEAAYFLCLDLRASGAGR